MTIMYQINTKILTRKAEFTILVIIFAYFNEIQNISDFPSFFSFHEFCLYSEILCINKELVITIYQ